MRISLFFIILFAITTSACNDGKTGTTEVEPSEVLANPASVTNIEVQQFADKMSESVDVQIIDVRTPGEWQSGCIARAQRIDWRGNDFDNKVTTLDKNKPVMLYCASGGRSIKAAERMIELGFNQVYNLNGGMNAWRSFGLETVK